MKKTATLESELVPPPIPEEIPPPIPTGSEQAPAVLAEDEEEEPEKSLADNLADGKTFSLIGGGLLAFAGVSSAMLEPALLLSVTLLIAWVVTRIEYGHKDWIKGGLGKRLWDKLMSVWSIHGGSFYGLVCLLHYLIPEIARMKLTWPGFNPEQWVHWFFVDRFVNFATYSWQSFMWPYNWVMDYGMQGAAGLVMSGFGLFELTRAGARKFSSWLERKK